MISFSLSPPCTASILSRQCNSGFEKSQKRIHPKRRIRKAARLLVSFFYFRHFTTVSYIIYHGISCFQKFLEFFSCCYQTLYNRGMTDMFSSGNLPDCHPVHTVHPETTALKRSQANVKSVHKQTTKFLTLCLFLHLHQCVFR